MGRLPATVAARLLRAAALILVSGLTAAAAEFFVAPGGDDANAGTRDKPFATMAKAQAVVRAGDTVVIRGGTYAVREEQAARRNRGQVHVILLDKSGSAEKPITY